MAPFPAPPDMLPPLPPAPGEQPLPRSRLRAVIAGQIIAAFGALLLLASLFIGGWNHVRAVQVTLGDRALEDSYVGEALTTYTNSYSLAVWAYLKRGDAMLTLAAACVAVALALVVAGTRRRWPLGLAFCAAIATFILIVLDMRQLPYTVAEMATRFPANAADVQMLGQRPGWMMLLAFAGLLMQINGTLVGLLALPRGRRRWSRSGLRARAERQPNGEQQPVDEFQPRGPGEDAIEHAPALAQHAPDEGRHEGQGEPCEHRPA